MRAMKDSGVEWIGEIPQEWGTIKFKYLHAGMNTGEGIDKEFWSTNETDKIFYTAGLVPIHTTYLDFPEWKFTEENDLLLARNGTPYVYYPEKGACYTDHIIRAKLNKDVNKRFVQYCLQQSISSIVVESVSIATWSASLWNEQLIPYPSLDKQRHIVEYLDSKCSKIDTIIEKQQAVIEKLKEYKLSVITEAVTKGLNTDVEMKDSGVEWIGEVPKHWGVVKFGRCISIASNLVNPNNYLDYPQVSPECIEKNTAKLLDYKTVFESGVISWNHLFYKGQIIYSKIRPLLNKVIIAPFDGLCSADMYPIDTTENHKFVVYVILSNYFKAQVGVVVENRVKMPKINQSELSNIVVFMPCVDEQKRIVEFLDEKCEKIERLIASKELLIKKLTDYKKSLIYEVVTGKKEV